MDIGREATTAADSLLIAPSYAYLLRHTACPALQVGLELPATMADQHAHEVTIYTSKLTPNGPIYTPIARAAIGK